MLFFEFLLIHLYILLTFNVDAMIITKINFFIVNSLSDTFDDFVDYLLTDDVDLLKGELDYLLMQHLFNSIDLSLIKTTELSENDSLAA